MPSQEGQGQMKKVTAMRVHVPRKAAFLLMIAVAAVFAGGCVSMVSDQQEIAMGQSYKEELAKTTEFDTRLETTRYIQELGNRLKVHAPPRPAIDYSFQIVMDDSLNAFAIPGGSIYINSGTIKAASDEAELASVIAHEIGHVAGQHHKQTIAKATGAELGIGILDAFVFKGQGGGATQVAEMVASGVLLSYSREQEYDADRLGLEILSKSGYDPNGLIRFFDKLHAMQGAGGSSTLMTLFSSHPLTADRIERARGMINALPRKDNAIRDSQAFRAVNRLY
jgi:predicted Zn-dependent protease